MAESENVLATAQRRGSHWAAMSKERFIERQKQVREAAVRLTAEADVWLRMLEDRNLTSHAYDEGLACRIYRGIVQKYAPRLGAMAATIQNLSWE